MLKFKSKQKKMAKERKYITDTDFITKSCYRGDLYQLVYGIFYHGTDNDYEDIYNLIALLTLKQSSMPLRRAKLMLWKEEVTEILIGWRKYNQKKYDVWVIVPFLVFEYEINQTISLFQFAMNLLEQFILNDGAIAVTTNENDFSFPINKMQDFFLDFITLKYDNCYEGDMLDVSLYAITDEMIRRGIGGNLDQSNFIRGKHIIYEDINIEIPINENDELAKSPYYGEDLFRRYYIKPSNELEDSMDNMDIITTPTVKDETTLKEKCGIIYYMLKDKVDEDTIIKVVNYINGTPYNSEIKKENKNSIKRYVYSYRKDNVDYEMMSNIEKTLLKYEISLPKK